MPDTFAQRAAREIAEKYFQDKCPVNTTPKCWPCVCGWQGEDCDVLQAIAAIIERGTGDRERVLEKAAKWAVEMQDDDVCPAYYYGECPDPNDYPFPDSCDKKKKMGCMITRWEKEATQ